MEVNRNTTSGNLAYKKTVIDVLPCDWTVRELGPLVTITSGESPYLFSFCDSGIPYFKVDQLNNSTKFLGSTYTDYFISASSKTVPRGSILFPKRGASIMLNKVRLLEEDGYMDTNVMALTPTGDINGNYLFYILSYLRLSSVADITSIPQINNKHIIPFQVPCPPLAEQYAIADALSDVDELLAGLDAVISKKRIIKQATVQQLLTGKIRLPGFSGEWKTKRLGELGDFSKGYGIKREDISDAGLPCIRYGELYTRYENYILNVASRVPPSVALDALPIRTGDLLFAGSGETAEEIGRCAVYLGQETAYAGGDIVVLTPSEQSSIYLGHLMNCSTVSMEKARMGQGDAIVHISASNLAQIQLKLPSFVEQQAIATVLYDMDVEIAALERRREKTHVIKQGMMQALLTGKVRLAKPNSAMEGLTC